MNAATKKALTEKLSSVGSDKVVFHRDGSVTAKHGFFYTHGYHAENFAERIKSAVDGVTVIEAFDDWQPWPKDSYLTVKFTVGE